MLRFTKKKKGKHTSDRQMDQKAHYEVRNEQEGPKNEARVMIATQKTDGSVHFFARAFRIPRSE